tara:strand:- start:579 stop:776 length:198 start_codon:yes stop_codon:yes gene_type:complete
MDVRSEAVCVSGFIHLRVRDGGRREEDKMERPRVERSAVLLQTPPVLGCGVNNSSSWYWNRIDGR